MAGPLQSCWCLSTTLSLYSLAGALQIDDVLRPEAVEAVGPIRAMGMDAILGNGGPAWHRGTRCDAKIRTVAHNDSHGRFGQGLRIVDPIADHRHSSGIHLEFRPAGAGSEARRLDQEGERSVSGVYGLLARACALGAGGLR